MITSNQIELPLTRHVVSSKNGGATLAILDTAPHTETAALDAASVAEMALIPCKPALIDLHAITSTINVVRLANVPARIVFNAVPARGDRAEQAREAVKPFDVPCAPCNVGDRVAFIDAYNAGLTAQEYEPRGKASREIRDLYTYISAEMGYKMPKKPNLAEAFNVDENELQPKPELQVVEPQPPQTETKPAKQKAPKKKHIGGYFSNDVYTQMKILCAETGMTTQEILTEGLNAVFRMHNKPPIA